MYISLLAVTTKSWVPSRKWINLHTKKLKILTQKNSKSSLTSLSSIKRKSWLPSRKFSNVHNKTFKILSNQLPFRDEEELASLQEVVKCSQDKL